MNIIIIIVVLLLILIGIYWYYKDKCYVKGGDIGYINNGNNRATITFNDIDNRNELPITNIANQKITRAFSLNKSEVFLDIPLGQIIHNPGFYIVALNSSNNMDFNNVCYKCYPIINTVDYTFTINTNAMINMCGSFKISEFNTLNEQRSKIKKFMEFSTIFRKNITVKEIKERYDDNISYNEQILQLINNQFTTKHTMSIVFGVHNGIEIHCTMTEKCFVKSLRPLIPNYDDSTMCLPFVYNGTNIIVPNLERFNNMTSTLNYIVYGTIDRNYRNKTNLSYGDLNTYRDDLIRNFDKRFTISFTNINNDLLLSDQIVDAMTFMDILLNKKGKKYTQIRVMCGNLKLASEKWLHNQTPAVSLIWAQLLNISRTQIADIANHLNVASNVNDCANIVVDYIYYIDELIFRLNNNIDPTQVGKFITKCLTQYNILKNNLK